MIKVNGETVEIKRFPDGTTNVKCNPSLNDGLVVLSWHYENDAEFMAVAFLTKSYQARCNKVDLVLPYVPNARMDRIEQAGDIFAMKYFGEMINSLNFHKVFVLDTHSSVANAVIKNCWAVPHNFLTNYVLDEITKIEGETPIMFYPDEGAMKRYSKDNNIPFTYGVKNRDWKTGNILGLEIVGECADKIKGKSILIRDDICSKGGTFYYAAKKLKEMGAKNIYLFVSHCEKNIHKGEFGKDKVNLLATGLIKHVFTTNSIYNLPKNDMITVFNFSIEHTKNIPVDIYK